MSRELAFMVNVKLATVDTKHYSKSSITTMDLFTQLWDGALHFWKIADTDKLR